MAEARHFCPECGGIDIQITRQYVLVSEDEDTGATAKCPNCGWEGPLAKTVGAVTTEQFFDIEKVGDILLRVISKHAAGPFVQVMEFVGLLPKKLTLRQFAVATKYEHADKPDLGGDGDLKEKHKRHDEMVDQMREQVVKEMMAAAITAGFEAAEKAHRIYAVMHNTPLHPMLREQKPADREFGGN